MESGIEKISTVWLICLAGFGVALFILAIVPQANGMKNKAKTAIIPILPLVFVLSVGGLKGNSSRHALVLYADVMLMVAAAGVGIRITAKRRERIAETATEKENEEFTKREAWRVGGVLIVALLILLFMEYGPLIPW